MSNGSEGSDGSEVPAGVRIGWDEVPAVVRAGVEAIIGGGPVNSAATQVGGFSPGTAARLVTADGRRAFVKAVSSAQNPHTPGMHRREAEVVRRLPPSPNVPRLIGLYDDGEWVAAVFEDIDGRTPQLPWTEAEISAAAAALCAVGEAFTESPIAGLPTAIDLYRTDLDGWTRIRDLPPPDLDPWAAARLDELVRLGRLGIDALAGDALVHGDIRADNLLVRPGGSVVVIDWPWASTGAAWFDLLQLCVNADLHGGQDPERLAARHLAAVDPLAITAVLAGLCGYFTDVSWRPAPPGLPTVRRFQERQARSTLRWLRRRLDG